jgi:hypothetical protein
MGQNESQSDHSPFVIRSCLPRSESVLLSVLGLFGALREFRLDASDFVFVTPENEEQR